MIHGKSLGSWLEVDSDSLVKLRVLQKSNTKVNKFWLTTVQKKLILNLKFNLKN